MMLHFRPQGRWIGDLIPFFWRGEYHLFYLPRAPEGRHCWGHIVSRNLLDWEELPMRLSRAMTQTLQMLSGVGLVRSLSMKGLSTASTQASTREIPIRKRFAMPLRMT